MMQTFVSYTLRILHGGPTCGWSSLLQHISTPPIVLRILEHSRHSHLTELLCMFTDIRQPISARPNYLGGYRDFSVDGAFPTRCDGRTGSQGSQALLYWQTGLPQGTHRLNIQHTGVAPQWLNVDYFVVTSAEPETISSTTSTPVVQSGSEHPTGSIASSTPSPFPSSQASGSTQPSPNVTIIIAVVATASVALIALIWYICALHHRKLKQHAERDKEAAGSRPEDIIEPFNLYDVSPRSANPNANARHVINARYWEQHEASSYHPVEGGLAQQYSPSSSTYSAPPNHTHIQSLPVTLTGPVPSVVITPPDLHQTPWTSANSTHAGSESNSTRIETSSQTKAHYSGANHPNSYDSGTDSRTGLLASSTINGSLPPPPRYELGTH